MKKIILALVATVVCGKLFPILMLALLLVGLCVMIKEAADHAN